MFEIESTSSFNTDSLVSGNEYDYVTRTSLNQGILRTTGFINKESINPSGTWSLGLLQMDFFYRKKSWYSGQFVRKIVPKIIIKDSAILFFTTLLNKQKSKLLSVLVRDIDNVFRSTKINLPEKNGEIDFDFMESFIAELEAERVEDLVAQQMKKLSEYLKVCGLNNYKLSDDEQTVIDNFDNLEYNLFNLNELFGKSTRGKRLKSADRIPGELPFVTAGENNEGISDFIGNKVEVFSNNTITIDMFGSAKYRNYKYGADDHIAVVHTEKLSKYSAVFVTAAIHKSSHNGQFDYGKNFYAKDADSLWIKLPVKNNRPDYESMDLIISAIQKLVIKDLVLYTDKKIKAIRSVINKKTDY